MGFGKKKLPSDVLLGNIFRSEDLEDESAREHVCSVQGSWLGCVMFDGKRLVWNGGYLVFTDADIGIGRITSLLKKSRGWTIYFLPTVPFEKIWLP